jgi:hypothetical protein
MTIRLSGATRKYLSKIGRRDAEDTERRDRWSEAIENKTGPGLYPGPAFSKPTHQCPMPGLDCVPPVGRTISRPP